MRKQLRMGVGLVAVVVAGSLFWWITNHNQNDNLTTVAVERGSVRETISVSGFVEADNTANLTFPNTGRVSGIYVQKGDFVEADTLLATIGQSRLAAERSAALANLVRAEAARDEVVNGQTTEERAVTASTLSKARSAWEQTVATELQKVQNALIALQSNDLRAYSADPEEDGSAPTVSGSYLCAEEGQYTLEVYRSGADSGYSYRYSGLESGISNVSVTQPSPIGACGLSLEFTTNERYADSTWIISIPNTRSSTYLTYQNALTLAEQQAAQNIQAAKDALTLAENTATKDTAAPRVEALLIANADVTAAQAELARIDALLGDNSIYAPFAGTITDIDKLVGEIATTEPFITLLAEDAFTLTARIPEIDITKINTDQVVEVVFDAKVSETLSGHITYVSPLAVEIDGVAYFEAQITLDEIPTWMKSGLNADIEIITASTADSLRLPKRFVESDTDQNFVYLLTKNNKVEKSTVEVGLIGNDGFVEVTSLSEGTTVVAPN